MRNMSYGRFRQGRVFAARPRTVSLCVALLLGGMSDEAQAVLSAGTGAIEGRAPTVTGTVSILMPDGITSLTSTIPTVLGTTTPDQFTLAPLMSGLVFADADGDTPANPSLTLASPVTWVWTKPNGTSLTPAQRAQPFSTHFANGDIAKVSAIAQVVSTSNTGMPLTLGTPTAFSTGLYHVKVKIPVLPTLQVNGHQFALNSGFPKTGFVGAKFQLYMNGINASANGGYTYSSDQSWVAVDSLGNVEFIGTPTSANNTTVITMTDRSGAEAPRDFSFTLARWFVNNGGVIGTAAAADAYCASLGAGYTTPSYLNMTNAILNGVGTRASGGQLWPEWGDISLYNNGWFRNNYWAAEPNGTKRYLVLLSDGKAGSLNPYYSYYVTCTMAL